MSVAKSVVQPGRRLRVVPCATERRNDPETCPRRPSSVNRYCSNNLDLNAAEVEFGVAMQSYGQRSGRLHPGSTEILEVLRELGYRLPGKRSLLESIYFAEQVQVYRSTLPRRAFPLWSEVLGVALRMGYRKS